ncbi:hypothetical protein, partial [Streptomyces sp. NPDC006510]|uniref:hypothetical protein n=1 Tax=Streptomyces sp. NPDC006510 TaxID=3155600 RepID=UPI0033A4FA8C
MPLADVELLCCCEVGRPLRVLGLFHRPFVVLSWCDLEGVLPDPLLYRQKLLPPVPLYVRPLSEVFVLRDDVARSPGSMPPAWTWFWTRRKQPCHPVSQTGHERNEYRGSCHPVVVCGSIRNQVWFVCLAYRFFGGLIGLRSDGGEAA